MTKRKEINKIAAVVAKAYATNVKALKGMSRGSSRKYLVVAARQMLYYYLRTHTAYSLEEIAAFLRCCQATIIKGTEMAKKRLETSESFRSDLKRIESDLGFIQSNLDSEEGEATTPCERGLEAKMTESEDMHWRRILRFLQEVGLVVDYLHARVVCKRNCEPTKLSPLFAQAADADGELTDALIVSQLEAIARQARAGFVAGEGFPVFGPLEN